MKRSRIMCAIIIVRGVGRWRLISVVVHFEGCLRRPGFQPGSDGFQSRPPYCGGRVATPAQTLCAISLQNGTTTSVSARLTRARDWRLIAPKMKKLLASCVLAFLGTLPGMCIAGEEPIPLTMTREPEGNFSRGSREFQNVVGPYFYFTATDNERPSIDFLVNSTRFGFMLNDPYRAGAFSGNFELLGEVFGAGIFEGPGDVMAGATLIFRYNLSSRTPRSSLTCRSAQAASIPTLANASRAGSSACRSNSTSRPLAARA